jgi:hypothetical protein
MAPCSRGTRRTMADIQIPSTTQGSRATSSFGLISFSTGRTMTCTNTSLTKFVGETKQFYPFQKRVHTTSTAEAVTFQADGRQEVVSDEGDGNFRKQFQQQSKTTTSIHNILRHK